MKKCFLLESVYFMLFFYIARCKRGLDGKKMKTKSCNDTFYYGCKP